MLHDSANMDNIQKIAQNGVHEELSATAPHRLCH